MDFQFSDREEALRREIREFVKKELPPEWTGFGVGEEYGTEEGWEFTQQMAKKLASRGWLTMSWPEEYGGQGASYMEQAVYQEEMSYYRVPGIDMGIGGVTWVGPSLMLFGTESQKKEHLPRIARGERFWCTGYSEPGSGSDLASLQCRAVADGDDYVLNGQKVWTSAGHRAHWCWLAARTDPNVPKHKGISLFLVEMKTPGITIRPLVNMAGEAGFCEVFFDDARVPKSSLVGEENRGWYQLAVALDFERTSGINFVANDRRMLDELVQYAKETRHNNKLLAEDPLVRHRLAELAIECQVGRVICYRIAWMLSKQLIPNYESSMAKNFGAELGQRIASVGMQMLGLYGQLEAGSRWARLRGSIERNYLALVAATIAAGTSEICRSVIALRGLGLPR